MPMATLQFDISQDELPIFLAEADEHLQELDDALVRLERMENSDETLQYAFRAAHTLKGMAGMIGHRRMVDLTHMLETAFDSMRKKSLFPSTQLIDLCLKAVDGLRVLIGEVNGGQTADLDLEWYGINFSTFIHTGWVETLVSNLPSADQPAAQAAEAGADQAQPAAQPAEPEPEGRFFEARIARDSVASAARAFQLMVALQEVGRILWMEPTAEQIDTSQPVQVFRARVLTDLPLADIRASFRHISEVDSITLDGEAVLQNVPPPAPRAQPAVAPLPEPDRLGDSLVAEGLITQRQLEDALEYQQQHRDQQLILGKVLVLQGAISESQLNDAITRMVQTVRAQPLQSAAGTTDKTVRTSVERLDNLMNLVGELITDRNRLTQVYHTLHLEDHKNDQLGNLADTVAHLGRITDQLQEEVMRIRMLPIANVFSKFPRLVRDLAQQTGKDVELVMKGKDTELDRSVIQEINDPLIHLIRNAVDHGIESPQVRRAAGKPARGTVTLTARHEQNHIILTVEDDGAGIDGARIRETAVRKGIISEADAAKISDEKAVDLIFLSGFSTNDKATEISGRGVGMDIVRNNIQHINGSIQVDTQLGAGSKFQIILPLTLAIVPTLLVQVGQICFAVPLVMVLETLRLRRSDIDYILGKPVITLREQVLPLVNLRETFELDGSANGTEFYYVVVVRSGKDQAGLVVDRLVGEEEVVVKSLGALVKKTPGIASAAILGDGQVALIMDIPGLFKYMRVSG